MKNKTFYKELNSYIKDKNKAYEKILNQSQDFDQNDSESEIFKMKRMVYSLPTQLKQRIKLKSIKNDDYMNKVLNGNNYKIKIENSKSGFCGERF